MSHELAGKDSLNQSEINTRQGIADANSRFLVFTLGTESFAIPLLTVREVIAVPEFTKVPNSPDYFLGIANLRGQIISAIDLRKKLKISTGEQKEPAVILCDVGAIQIGILVDSVNQVLAPKADELVDPPRAGTMINRELISGVFRRNDELVFFLDLGKILDASDRQAVQVKRVG
jgi:purine-binding chemotaxis protein CheW